MDNSDSYSEGFSLFKRSLEQVQEVFNDNFIRMEDSKGLVLKKNPQANTRLDNEFHKPLRNLLFGDASNTSHENLSSPYKWILTVDLPSRCSSGSYFYICLHVVITRS